MQLRPLFKINFKIASQRFRQASSHNSGAPTKPLLLGLRVMMGVMQTVNDELSSNLRQVQIDGFAWA